MSTEIRLQEIVTCGWCYGLVRLCYLEEHTDANHRGANVYIYETEKCQYTTPTQESQS